MKDIARLRSARNILDRVFGKAQTVVLAVFQSQLERAGLQQHSRTRWRSSRRAPKESEYGRI